MRKWLLDWGHPGKQSLNSRCSLLCAVEAGCRGREGGALADVAVGTRRSCGNMGATDVAVFGIYQPSIVHNNVVSICGTTYLLHVRTGVNFEQVSKSMRRCSM